MNVAEWKKAPDHPVKVIQFGEGNFLRGFVDWMIHKMNEQNLFNGSVAVVQPLAKGLLPILESQNYTYTHYLKGIKNQEPVIEYYKNTALSVGINPYEDFESYLSLAHIETASIIVSNTTEAGIVFDSKDQLDMEASVTYPGKLTRLMYERYEAFKGDPDKGYIVLPCELIDNNADRLKEAVMAYIDLWNLGETFKTWVEKSNQFCNTLVDRIVPGYPKENIKTIWEELGYEDQLVVESEQFNLWVIQGNDKVQQAFPADEAGCQVLFVDDVTPYKVRKVRILNGAHTTLVPVAYLYGIETVLESVEDPQINQFLMKAIFDEIIPTLTLSKEALEIYAAEVILRFKNPFVKHYLMSISLNSMSKYQTRVLPSLLAYFDQNSKLPKRLVAALASYMVFYRGEYAGKKIAIVDNEDILKLYKDAWKQYDGSKTSLVDVVEAVLGYEPNWKGNLNHIPGLRDQVVNYVSIILDEGMENLIHAVEDED
ncbi:tagaturonate reductase (altronate oxidoreductase) [Petrocella atlantisensis]|uniref:Tagaturonate reductase (Altronate oxidoreductase) n=1 Tax=Petrocella atlantisensis TaxID=2173034 RepID=A0A3P7PFP4_9FIRM|nr:tagaturonate reductase [Petrocella atlantisensis]VDN47718.1 tagaturonate reductase (altronate oxidoreductase) [Petrocella atlantisensis]